MRKIVIVLSATGLLLFLQNCSQSKKAQTAAVATVSYEKDIMPIMQASCAPCHFPPGGRAEALNSYDAVKKHIGEVIERVKLPKEDIKFMPYKNKKPALSDSVINILVQWKDQNAPQ
ncbi:MAG: hypothetical protein QM791_17315 [Ferruginibacter sp.]